MSLLKTMKSIIFAVFCLIFGTSMDAQTESFWGKNKEEIVQRFASQITSRGPNGITLRTQFLGHEADVYLGFFRDGKVGFIEVSFTSFKQALTQKDRLNLFKDVRNRLEGFMGHSYSYARIDGVDVLGESGGWIPDKRMNNAFVFGTMSKGLVYQVEIFGQSIGDLVKTGDVTLTIDRAESLQAPRSK